MGFDVSGVDAQDPVVSKKAAVPYTTIQLGVWRVLTNPQSSWKLPGQHWKDVLSSAPDLRRYLLDVYRLGPHLFIFMILCELWDGIENTVLLYLSSRLLNVIEAGLVRGQPDVTAICSAAVARVLCMIIAAAIRWCRDIIRPVARSRVKLYFDALFLQANLGRDLATSQENSSKIHVSSSEVWYAFPRLIGYFSLLFSVASQLAFGIHLFRFESGGLLFAFLCVAKPLLNAAFVQDLWSKAYVTYASNVDYLRMLAMKRLSKEDYREEVIAGNLAEYVLREHAKAMKSLGDVSDDYPASQYAMCNTPWWDILNEIVGDLPMLYYTANAIFNPSEFSITSIAMLQQTLGSLRWTLERLLLDSGSLPESLNIIKGAYEALDVKNKLKDGPLPYPADDIKNNPGMSLEVRNLSFEYPGSKSTRNALKEVSFSIKSGQLVVIVGANGSGKSTIIKILNRLYDATSGEILVDGRNIAEYRVFDLREASASLTQDHHIYPLTVSENIGLGHAPCLANTDMILKSAKQGGAYQFLSNLKEGLQTTLQPVFTGYSHRRHELNKQLQAEYDTLEKSVDVSGGEQQRLVASRTFMRLNSDKIKFVTVDEPSSALDPQGEFELFEELRKAKAGKTMIFVTHRFGHLTRHADLILCMKDGSLVESGTHGDLISRNGEYSKLYNIQAQAFAPGANASKHS